MIASVTSQIVGWVFLVLILATCVGGLTYGGYRIVRNKARGWLWALLGFWIIGLGWIVGLIYVLGPDRRDRMAKRRVEPLPEKDISRDAFHEEVIALSYWTGVKRSKIVRELKQRSITTREWAAERDIDTSDWRTPA